ncbi:MAG: hypothetical protein AUK34_01085 [Ignavibacteria bacterium CG2_30_36_16]|nr:MAG: hypothetical protein AUK34_01085 [Ignavibacteria bacterium CG2_30_36_16]
MLKLVTKNLLSVVLFSFFLFNIQLMAQANTVELRDGTGTLLANYASITEAYSAIPATVTQAYLIEILPAYDGSSETFPIQLTVREGASATNTITIRPKAGNSGEQIVAAVTTNPVILFNDADFVILDGRPGGVGDTADLVIENTLTSGSSSNTINFINGATNNEVKYCFTKNHTQTTAGPRNIFFSTSASNASGNSDNLIYKCKIMGGRSTIGTSGTTASPNSNNVVLDCEIFDFGYAGLWILGATNNFTIEGCQIYQTTGISSTIVSGIITGTSGLGIINIKKNKIFDLQSSASGTSSIRGIYVTPGTGSTYNIENNFISMMLDNGPISSYNGIQIIGSNSHTSNIYYNSVRIGGVHSTGGTAGSVVSSGILKSNSGANTVYNQINNICINERTGGPGGFHVGSAITSLTGTLNVNYNCYSSRDGTYGYNAAWGSSAYNILSDYKTAADPNEGNSLFKSVNFVSYTDLHLTGTSISDVDLTALPIAGITEDIDGQLRHSVTPYKGADEADAPIPVELTNFSATVSNSSVTLHWSTATETNSKGFEIERNMLTNGGKEISEWKKIGFVSGNGTSTELNNYSFTDNSLASGNYSYRLKQIDFDGSFAYYWLNETVEVSTPVEFALLQNYPNPFNPVTKIKYAVSIRQYTTLKVYNILGREVATLVNEYQAAGNYEVKFDASNLSSGVYFYKLQSGNFVQTKKLLLMK